MGKRDVYLKRVVAIPGDRVEMDAQGAVTVWAGGDRSQGTSYCSPGAWKQREPQGWTLPEGRYFVLGENCWHTIDSRSAPSTAVRSVVPAVIPAPPSSMST